MKTEAAGGRAALVNIGMLATLTLCIARLWVMPLPSGFWVDEMVTQFVARHPHDPTLSVAPQVTQSIYYMLPRAMERWFGFSETAYRIPSLILMLGALWLIARIAARLIHPDAAWFAMFLCFTLRDFSYQAADARPYALATFVTAAGLWLLIRWLDRARWPDAVLFAIAASLEWRVHLVLWPMYVLFALYAVVRVARGDTRVGWIRLCVVFGAIGVALIPVLGEAIALNRQAAAHVVTAIPSAGDLVNALKLGVVVGACATAVLAGRLLKWPSASKPIPWESLWLILGWWICDPLCLFLYSIVTRHSVFLERYMYAALPGAALAGAAAASVFVPARYWKRTAALLGVGVLVFAGRWNHLRIVHHRSDWRGAAQALNAQAFSAAEDVICPSPFIEARPPVWRPDYPVASFLYSHLLTYTFRGKIVPFPFGASLEAGPFAASFTEKELSKSQRFALYGSDRAVNFWREWFAMRPELAGFENRSLGDFGDVVVVVFEREPSGK